MQDTVGVLHFWFALFTPRRSRLYYIKTPHQLIHRPSRNANGNIGENILPLNRLHYPVGVGMHFLRQGFLARQPLHSFQSSYFSLVA